MKKLSLYVFLVLMFCNVGFAEEILINCLIGDSNLKAIDKKDRPRFVGQTISLKIDTKRKIITNTNPDSNVYLIHGIKDQVEMKISKIEKSETISNTNVDRKTGSKRDNFLEWSKKTITKKKVTLSKDYKNLKKGTVITFENVKNFSAEEWFDIPVDDRRSLRDLKYAKKKYNTLPLNKAETPAKKGEREAAEVSAKDKDDKSLVAGIRGGTYSYNSEIIVLDDKDNEIIYKYTGSYFTSVLVKVLKIKINDSRSITQKLLYKDLEFEFYNCGK